MERCHSRLVYTDVNTRNTVSSTANTTRIGSISRVRPVPSRRPKPGVRRVKRPRRSRSRSPAPRRACRCDLPTHAGGPALRRTTVGKGGGVSRLAVVVLVIERHWSREIWYDASRLSALVRSTELRRAEPALADRLGLPPDADTLAALEQPALPERSGVEEALASIIWPDAVEGCALVIERVVLPPEAEAELPEDE